MAEAAQADEPGRAKHQITSDRFKLAEVERQDWVCTAHFGTRIDEITDPAYWAHIASKLRPYDHIEVRVDDSSWIAEVLVLEAGRNWARVMITNKWTLDSADVSQTVTESYKVVWKGPMLKWSVVRLIDSAMLSKEHTNKSQAEDWLRSYEKSVG